MAFQAEHELHKRRFGRNLGLGLALGAFVLLVFGLSIVKIAEGDRMHSGDHRPLAEQVGASGS